MFKMFKRDDRNALELLEELSIKVSLLQAFTDYYINLDDGCILFRLLNRFHPENDISFRSTENDRSFRVVLHLLDFLRDNSIPSFHAKDMIDGVDYDLAYKFKGARKSRVILFCPGVSPDPVHKEFEVTIQRVFEKLTKKCKRHNM